MKKICLEQKGHQLKRASLGEGTFHAFLYKTWRTVYITKSWLGWKADPPCPVTFLQWWGQPPGRANFFPYFKIARGTEKKMHPLVGWRATILHFFISHDTPCLHFPPCSLLISPGKLRQCLCKFRGESKVPVMEDVQMANRCLKENDSFKGGSIRVFRVNTSHVWV